MASLLRLGLFYGVAGFVAGFFFGALRELALVPALGETLARRIEFPMVTAAVAIIGCWLTRTRASTRDSGWLLGLGACGVATLVVIESVFALVVLGVPLEAYLRGFNPAAGNLFTLGLAVMALAPVFSRAMQRFDRAG